MPALIFAQPPDAQPQSMEQLLRSAQEQKLPCDKLLKTTAGKRLKSIYAIMRGRIPYVNLMLNGDTRPCRDCSNMPKIFIGETSFSLTEPQDYPLRLQNPHHHNYQRRRKDKIRTLDSDFPRFWEALAM